MLHSLINTTLNYYIYFIVKCWTQAYRLTHLYTHYTDRVLNNKNRTFISVYRPSFKKKKLTCENPIFSINNHNRENRSAQRMLFSYLKVSLRHKLLTNIINKHFLSS